MNHGQHAGAEVPLIRIVDVDRATLVLLQEWLDSAGFEVASGRDSDGNRERRAVLTIVDVPFTRHGAPEVIKRVTAQYPGTPILALSPTFFSNVACGGGCARALGVAGVLPKPVARDALLNAVSVVLQSRE